MEDEVWQDREIKFDQAPVIQKLRRGEFQIDSINAVFIKVLLLESGNIRGKFDRSIASRSPSYFVSLAEMNPSPAPSDRWKTRRGTMVRGEC